MPVQYTDDCARFEDFCGAEEALELLEWLRSRPRAAAVDLAACEHMHSSLLQVLLLARPCVQALPADPFLARWVAPLLDART